jgi:nucleoside-diphosphate-sugar epimerase
VQIIVRPSTVFGPEDKFLNLVGAAVEHLPFLPMVNKGRNRVQPVHCSDVGVAVNRIINVCIVLVLVGWSVGCFPLTSVH